MEEEIIKILTHRYGTRYSPHKTATSEILVLVKEYLKKQLFLHGVSQRRVELLAYHSFLQEELNLDLNNIWVDEYLKANNSIQSELLAFENWVNKNTTTALKDGIKLALENYKKANCG